MNFITNTVTSGSRAIQNIYCCVRIVSLTYNGVELSVKLETIQAQASRTATKEQYCLIIYFVLRISVHAPVHNNSKARPTQKSAGSMLVRYTNVRLINPDHDITLSSQFQHLAHCCILNSGCRGLLCQRGYLRPGFIGASSDENSRTSDRTNRDSRERQSSSA